MGVKSKVNFAAKAQICKQQVLEFLIERGFELETKEMKTDYVSLFQRSNIDEASDKWDDILPRNLMFDRFYSDEEQKALKRNKNFSKLCEIVDLYSYHVEKCDVRLYHLVPGNVYRYYKPGSKYEIKFLVRGYKRLKIAEVWLPGFEEEQEILMSSYRDILWVVRTVKEMPQLESPGRECCFVLGKMTPEIANSISLKSHSMKKILATMVEAKGKIKFSGNLGNIKIADLFEQVQDLSLDEVGQLMFQHHDLELNRKEINALEDLAEIQDIHKEIASGLKNLNKVPYKPGGKLSGFVDNRIFGEDFRRSAFYFVHRDKWMVHIFIKSKLRFDYMLWVNGTFMTVSLVENLEDVEVLKPLIEADEKGEINEYLFSYELRSV